MLFQPVHEPGSVGITRTNEGKVGMNHEQEDNNG